jgi:transposase
MGRPSRYPDEFRHEAVQMALASNESRASVARRLGVNETTLRNWVANELAEQERAASPLSVSPSEFEELRRLRREVVELRVEKEILRKAAAYFAQETIRSAASDSSPIIDTPNRVDGSISLRLVGRMITPATPRRRPA